MAVEGFPHPHPRPVGAAPERPDGAPPGGARPGWRPWTGILALVSGLAGALMGALVLGVVAAAGGASLSDLPGWVNVASTIVQDVAFIAAALLFARTWATPTPAQFGLRPAPVRRSLGLAVLAWIAFYAFTAIFVAALGLHPSEEDLQDQLGVHGTVGLAALAVLVTVVAPVAEEFLFRGYVFTALRNWRGIWPAAVITGLLFGAVHAGGSDPSYLVPAGLLRLRAVPPVRAHGLAVAVHRAALREQQRRVRGVAGLELAGAPALRGRAGAHRGPRARGRAGVGEPDHPSSGCDGRLTLH